MLALSRAIVSEPKVVLLDEVSLGLAPRVADELFTALAWLREAGVALLCVEQHVSRVLQVADQVYVLKRGAIVFSGAPDALDGSALTEFYLGAVPQPLDPGPFTP
jgi:branched-chain amino acid transport system ATP-binding protein